MKHYISFGINEDGGQLWISHKEIDPQPLCQPLQLSAVIISDFNLDIQTIIEEYVVLSNRYGGVKLFENFQPNYTGFLKHLRSL